ncbi:excinuclease ABC subunit UvrB [Pigmentibacter sp. JX0631]|uniref:excinuclease ABC subunit UvrB n=1 Tax=Pigmentibacter sp. JX0631 TaxID=2976982 RepID=UPI00246825C2|nr:excinuclease ABC subunit UvrB [Pigmentibacter sp. JX0631]WGL59633.1 excinuclease ABC subunit UvrB [Pigmentibacter sp. JX0631]
MSEKPFEISWPVTPTGDQPQAIEKLVSGLSAGLSEQILLGVTGSGKTFTIANVVAKTQRPTLVIAHNKTLAAQLFQEFKELFPNNAVEYFISYYDYYQPEAYLPSTDTFIDKSASINDNIDKMRHSATKALFERRDVIIVSSVSCIYGLGAPDTYLNSRIVLNLNAEFSRDDFIRQLISIQYTRNDISLERGKFRVRGDIIEVVPSSENERAVRIQFWGDKIEKLSTIDALKGTVIEKIQKINIYPASHYVLENEKIDEVISQISHDLIEKVSEFKNNGKHIEAQRIEQRTLHDLEMIREIGYCQGIENYSRYLDGRSPGKPPATLLDYFPKDYLLVIDESHVTVPQIGGMYRGDRARKETLVQYGFRLPAALDNRPLNFDEFKDRMGQTIYVSATPAKYELEHAGTEIVEQIIRPTGLIDPQILVKPAKGQIDDLLFEIQNVVAKKERILITTLTKKMAENITAYYAEFGIKIKYLHSEIQSIERVEILRDLRLGIFDVLVGINLLREGLDLPEVSLVAILDADKEGFLRSKTSLIQTVGRAARNANGRVILYADKETESIKFCIEETSRRREKQEKYNTENNITPQTVYKKIPDDLKKIYNLDYGDEFQEKLIQAIANLDDENILKDAKKLEKYVQKMQKEMIKASQKMDFELAAQLRDKIFLLKEQILLLTGES